MKITHQADELFKTIEIGETFSKHDLAERIGCNSEDLSWFINKHTQEGEIQTDGWANRKLRIRLYKRVEPKQVEVEPMDAFLKMRLI